jgi:hypothetical protein
MGGHVGAPLFPMEGRMSLSTLMQCPYP